MADRPLAISLAAWSLHKRFFAKEIDQLGMIDVCQAEGIGGLELVNTFFPAPQYAYLRHLRKRSEDANVRLLLIMCDLEGDIGHPERPKRLQAAANHRKWVDIAAVLGCHAIRINARGDEADPAAMRDRCAEAIAWLLDYARGTGVDITIENHGGLSSDPDWLVSLMDLVNDPHLGTLPDFGNFPATVDRYAAVERLMPSAKAVSAKCYDFDADGNETKIDFPRMMQIVKQAGYEGYVGIEYEGERMTEGDGIRACKSLLEGLI